MNLIDLLPVEGVSASHYAFTMYRGNLKPVTQIITLQTALSHHCLSYVCTSNLLFSPCKELMFRVWHDLVTGAQSRAELLSEQLDVLRECFRTILRGNRQEN